MRNDENPCSRMQTDITLRNIAVEKRARLLRRAAESRRWAKARRELPAVSKRVVLGVVHSN